MRYARRVAIMLALLVILGLPWTLRPQDITTLVKIFGLGYVVKQYAAPLNDFVNSVLANKGVAVREKTKVVPILTVGVGQASYIGPRRFLGPPRPWRRLRQSLSSRRISTRPSASKPWSRSIAPTRLPTESTGCPGWA
jgi:hypothetical protein